jgi:hypothetical protein
MRLNQREVELLGVTRDLFLKGSPEFRVAKYARENHFTEQQLHHFLSKITVLPEPVRIRILNHLRDMEQGTCFDESERLGNDLIRWLKQQKKVQITDA